MATYDELSTLAGDNVLIDRIAVAITIAAEAIVNELDTTPNHANRLVWAKSAFQDPKRDARSFLFALLAADKDATVAQITGASDAAIQTRVDAVVDIFAGA